MRAEAAGIVMVFMTAGLTIIVATALFYRHKRAELLHRERMTAMEKGVVLPVFETPKPPQDPIQRHLLAGLIWLFSGTALAVFLFSLIATTPQTSSISMYERRQKIEELRTLGAGDEELRKIVNDPGERVAKTPLGLGAVALIPMAVGFAYLVFYSSERKRYPGGSEKA